MAKGSSPLEHQRRAQKTNVGGRSREGTRRSEKEHLAAAHRAHH